LRIRIEAVEIDVPEEPTHGFGEGRRHQ
jgi:hypothetical protein